MDHIEFKSGFTVTTDELNGAQTFLSSNIRKQFTDLCTYGVLLKHSSDTLVDTSSKNALGIYNLVAYDEYGNRIEVRGQNTDKAAISGLRPDFSQNALLTQSGTDFTPNTEYYLVIRYAEVDDYTSPSYNIISGARAYKHKKASYQLFLRLLNEQSSTSGNIIHVTEGDVILAKLTVDGDKNITADESVKNIAYVDASTVGGVITKEGAENYGSVQTFADHINAIGSGTVTNTNIHGLSAEDLGIDVGATGRHQQLLHTNGIRTDRTNSTSSAFYPYYLDESATNSMTLYISPLYTAYNECCVINGTTYMPSSFANTYACSFNDKAGSGFSGYYLFYVDSSVENSASIKYAGPFTSEDAAEFTTLLNDATKLPICSFKWDEITYSLENTTSVNFGVVPGTFKDRRSFFNMSLSLIKPDEVFALSQFAPTCTDQAYLHNARIVGTNAYGSYYVVNKELEFIIDGDTENTIVVRFDGTSPDSILDALISAFIQRDANNNPVYDTTGNPILRAYPYFTTEGTLAITASSSIRLRADTSTAAEVFGFTTDVEYASDNIQVMVYVGDKNGYIDFVYENPASLGDQGNLVEVRYFLGGGKFRYNRFTYDEDTGLVSRVEEGVNSYVG